MVPYSLFFFAIDTLVIWRVINWFNAKIHYFDLLPIRGSAYILSILNEQVGKGAMALYLNRRDGVPGWEVGSSMLFVMFCEFYYLLGWATIGITLQWDRFPEVFHLIPWIALAAIIHKFGVSVDFLRKFRAESVFRCDYKASKLVEPNRDEARAPSGNSSARRGLYICVGAGSQGTVRWDTDGASVMRRAFVRDKTMPGAPRCDEKFPEPGHRF